MVLREAARQLAVVALSCTRQQSLASPGSGPPLAASLHSVVRATDSSVRHAESTERARATPGVHASRGSRRRLPSSWLVLAAACAVLSRARADAATPRWRIEWEAPSTCPDSRAMYERLRERLGDEAISGELPRVRGVIVPIGDGQRLHLDIEEGGRRSSRVISGGDCDELVDAAVLAITLALQGDGTVATLDSAPSKPLSEQAGAPVLDDGRLDGLESAPRSPVGASKLRVSGTVEAVLDSSALPEPAPGLAIAVRGELDRFGLSVYAAWLPAQRLRVRANEFVDFELATGGVRACHDVFEGVIRGDACALLEVGRLAASSADLDSSRDVANLWLATGAAFEVRQRVLQSLEVQLRAEPLVPLLRKQYAVNQGERVHATAPLDARLSLGLAITME